MSTIVASISPKLLELETSNWYTALCGELLSGAQKFSLKVGISGAKDRDVVASEVVVARLYP